MDVCCKCRALSGRGFRAERPSGGVPLSVVILSVISNVILILYTQQNVQEGTLSALGTV